MTHIKRQFRTSPLANVLSQVVTPLLRSHDVKGAGLFYDWKRIVSEPLASLSHPEKITYPKSALGGGTLFLTIASSITLYVQHNQAQIMDQINTYFGYKAISHLKFKQSYFQTKPAASPAPSLSVQEKETIASHVQTIEDETLLTALQALGETILLDEKQNMVDRKKGE